LDGGSTIQLLKTKSGNGYVVFFRWGVVGDTSGRMFVGERVRK
jgi:hypothetical protein